jgi:hypothetical protein
MKKNERIINDYKNRKKVLEELNDKLSEWYVRECILCDVLPDKVLDEDIIFNDGDCDYEKFEKGSKLYKIPERPKYFERNDKYYIRELYGTVHKVLCSKDGKEFLKEQYGEEWLEKEISKEEYRKSLPF